MAEQTRNREAWLHDFAALALPLIKLRTGLAQEDRKILISCGFPSSGATRRKSGSLTTGQCHHTHGTDRQFFQIFIHPVRTDPYDVGETVLHELVHALLPGGVGHRKPYSRAAKALGLIPSEEESYTGIAGKPTSTQLSKELAERVKEIIEQIGPYPHEKLEAFGKVQATRLIKCECPICGYLARVTAKWIDECGPPICPQDGVSFVEGGCDDGAEVPLFAAENHIIYYVKATSALRKAAVNSKIPLTYDPRWTIAMDRKGNDMIWHVVDLGETYRIVTKRTMVKPDGQKVTVNLLKPELEMVFGDAQPRHYKAESKADAIELLEGLRDGSITPESLDLKDDDPELDTFYEGDYLDEDEDEGEDFDDGDPRFQFEIDKGMTLEDALKAAEDEAIRRES